ncbi:TetR/AcrR family transcriptional regulator [Actinoplanes missouriensis]|uniref:TetR/AcrR family transcriptional regulator n=1 Tax=Actinoplanes missouriensis TaxID=1866 RepID=UPI0018D2DB7D|nr:TetR/AcrR family transcriptional regulator [Actinoplanes missouriensis]
MLAAAARLVRRKGVAASLDAIAREAGVSKGGLAHHFASKEALLIALAQRELEAFRESVLTRIDATEGRAGRLTRAYVRASLRPADDQETRARFAVIAQLMTVPAVAEIAAADHHRWQRDLAGDGVPAETRHLVIAAANGFGGPPLRTFGMPAGVRDRMRTTLITMINAAVG